MPARVARTASHAWANAVLPYLLTMGEHGVETALRRSFALRQGLVVRHGVPREAARS